MSRDRMEGGGGGIFPRGVSFLSRCLVRKRCNAPIDNMPTRQPLPPRCIDTCHVAPIFHRSHPFRPSRIFERRSTARLVCRSTYELCACVYIYIYYYSNYLKFTEILFYYSTLPAIPLLHSWSLFVFLRYLKCFVNRYVQLRMIKFVVFIAQSTLLLLLYIEKKRENDNDRQDFLKTGNCDCMHCAEWKVRLCLG